MATAEVHQETPSTLYVLSRKWWELYANSPDYTPRWTNIITAPQIILSLNNEIQAGWNIQIDPGSIPDAVNYIILDPPQWKKFCKWYNGGPVLKPKSSRGISFQYDGATLGFNGGEQEMAEMKLEQLLNPFVLGHGGEICTTVPQLLHRFTDPVIPLKVLMKGVWPDDTANALPNACEFAGEENKRGNKKKRSAAAAEEAAERRHARKSEAAMENMASAVTPAGMANLGGTCYMNASFQFLLRPLSKTHYNQVKETSALAPEAVILEEFVEVWRLLLTNNFKRGGRSRRDSIKLTNDLVPTLRREWAGKNGGGGAVMDDSKTEDSQEFMQFIFQNVLDEHCGEFSLRTFGVIDSEVLDCRNCGKIQALAENPYDGLVWMLGIPFPDDDREPMNHTFQDLLRRRCEGHRVDDKICRQCGKRDNMWSRSALYATSEFLIMYFGRAVLDEKRLNHRINGVPKTLELREYFREDRVEESGKYKVCGVVDHRMVGSVGHFVTTLAQDDVADADSRKWFEFDDDCVALLSHYRIDPNNVYMLMYKKL